MAGPLQRLLEEVGGVRFPEGFTNIVVTGTGFQGDERLAFRALAHHCGFRYSGDLVRGWTTHLVCCSGGSGGGEPPPAAAGRATTPQQQQLLQQRRLSAKVTKAAEWGIPAVGLSWLVASVREGAAQPAGPYLLPPPPTEHEGPEGGRQQGLKLHGRTSSVASSLAAGAHQQQQQQPAPAAARQQQRQALGAVDNVLQRLRAMSISPEPAKPSIGPPPSHDSPLSSCGEAPPQEGSPQQSLSLQGLLQQVAGQGPMSPGDDGAVSSAAASAGAEPPGTAPSSSPPGSSPPSSQHFSPMAESPAWQQQQLSPNLASNSPLSPMAADSPAAADLPAGQLVGSGGMPPLFCTIPTPAVVRQWNDDCSPVALGGSTPLGITQTPPVIRGILQPSLQHSAAERGAASVLRTPAAVREWSDDETVASPLLGEHVVADSDSEEEEGGQHAAAGSAGAGRQQPQQQQQLTPPGVLDSFGGGAGAAAEERALQQGGVSPLEAAAAARAASCAPSPSGSPGGGQTHAAARGSAPPSPAACLSQQPSRQPSRSAATPAAGAQGGQAASTSGRPGPTLRDWSDDSDCDDVPSPQGYARGHTGLTQLDPASLVIARPPPAAPPPLPPGASCGEVALGLKFLLRPPRGNSVREHHTLPNLKGVQFAEQVQLPAAGLLLSTKDKKTALRLEPGRRAAKGGTGAASDSDDDFAPCISSGGSAGGAAPSQQQGGSRDEPLLVEAQSFYRLPDGSWWTEHCRLLSASQAEAAATAAGQPLALPRDFDRSCELLHSMAREHAPLSDVAGAVQVQRVKAGGTTLRLRGAAASRSYFWRWALDPAAMRVLTDRPVTDYVTEH